MLNKAQARFNESSQKLDLLKYSLEQRLNELPKNHPKSSIIIEELSLVSSPTLSPRQSIISTQNQYSTLSKPAALTGLLDVCWLNPETHLAKASRFFTLPPYCNTSQEKWASPENCGYNVTCDSGRGELVKIEMTSCMNEVSSTHAKDYLYAKPRCF